MKKPLIVALIAIIVIAIVVFSVLSNLDSLVAKAIEKHGSEATQTSVRVSGVDISLREGRGSIKGLQVASPDGFRARTAFSLSDITVTIDIRNVRQDPIVIDAIRVQAPVVNAEITKTGASNIDELRKRVQAQAAGTAKESGKSEGRITRIRIEQFVIEKGRIEVDASALGLEKRTIELPDIRLDNVGGTNGVPPDEIARIILTAVAGKATNEIAGSEIDRLVKEKLGGSLRDKAKGLLEKIGN
ncbi:MAG: hypothetical protein PHD74_06545 [Candidatus Krumholzibacteria bacterium]|nr:hypothetical protein [Candidatus Krumholzibacteria bacterium]